MPIDFQSLVKTCPIVDTHNDFPYLLRSQLHNEINSFDFHRTTAHTDLERLKKGGVGIQFFSCFIECKDEDMFYQDFNKPNSAARDTLEQIDVTNRLCDQYEELARVSTSDEAWEVFHSGKLAVTLGVEGLHQVDSSLGVLRLYHKMGVRYITLTHNCDNPFATAASSVTGGLPDKGLSDYGIDCIKEMNRLGMIVDLSHVSVQTMHDALDTSISPVMFSHSSCKALNPHNRNVPDDVLLKLKQNNGVLCINFFPLFLQQGEKATIDDAVDHIVHAVNVMGWDYVGLGSDFDGIDHGPEGLEDVSKYPDLIEKVAAKTGAGEAEVAKLMGKNVMRVWKANELIAEKLKDQDPIESNWSERKWEFDEYILEFPELFPGARDKARKENHITKAHSLLK